MSRKGKRAKVLGGMIRQFQNGVDSMTQKYLNKIKGIGKHKYKK